MEANMTCLALELWQLVVMRADHTVANKAGLDSLKLLVDI